MARLLFAVLIFCSAPVFAQSTTAKQEGSTTSQSTAQIDPAKRADIIKMLKLAGSDKLAVQVINNMVASQRLANPNVPAQFWSDFVSEVDPNELLEISVPSWNKHFSHNEIKELIVFYQSPIGKKLTATQPKLVQESMVAGQQWGLRLGQKIADGLKKNQK